MDWKIPLAALARRGRKSSVARRLIALDQLGRPAWTPRRYDAFADEGYRKNVIAFRAIGEVAQAAASVPWALFRRERGRRTRIDAHPLLALLARPNPLAGGPAFLEALHGFRLIAGNAYVEAVASEGRPPVELHALRPDRMRVVPGAAGLPAAYRYTVGGRSRDFAVDQVSGRSAILHIKAFHGLQDPGRRALRALLGPVGVRQGGGAPARAHRGPAAPPVRAAARRLTGGHFHRGARAPATTEGDRTMKRCILMLAAGLLLAGCETATTALATLGVQGLTLGGQYLFQSAEEDVAEAREWRGKHKALVAVIEAACIQGANATMADGGWEAARADYQDCLSMSVDNQPQILVERLTDRVERARAERNPDAADEAVAGRDPADGDEDGGS